MVETKSMEGESPETQRHLAEKPQPIIQFKGAHEKFKKRNSNDPELVRTFDELFLAFNSEVIKNSKMFTTADGQASFPYTSIDVTDFARRNYKPDQQNQTPGGNEPQTKSGRDEKYFIIGSHLLLRDGSFTNVEIAIHEFMKRLPTILKDLEAGKTPRETEIFITGAPTSMFGHVGPELADRVSKAPTQTYAELFKEFVDHKLPQDEAQRQNTHVTLHGYSMGSSWAARTGELMADKNPSAEKPLVIMDAPAGFHEERKGIIGHRLTAGFIVDGLIALATRSDFRRFFIQERGFWSKLAPYLERNNGFHTQLDPAQTKLKTRIKDATVKDLRQGIPVDKNKINAVVRWNKADLSMLTPSFARDVVKRELQLRLKKGEKREDGTIPNPSKSLGKDQQPGYEPRTFAIKSSHVHPFLRNNELRRWENTARLVQNLQQNGRLELPPSPF